MAEIEMKHKRQTTQDMRQKTHDGETVAKFTAQSDQ